MMNILRRLATTVFYLWLCGALFILFLLGYAFYGILWTVRLFQTKKLLLLAAVAALLICAGMTYYFFLPQYGQHERVEIVIGRKATVHAIADSLVRHDIITSKKTFALWLKLSHIGRRIQAGRCTFETRGGVMAAARALLKAAPLEKMVTIPEGLTIEQTAERLRQVFPIDTEEFIRLCSDTAVVKECGLPPLPSLEGFLFPDSYSFPEEAKPRDMVRRMAGRFNEEYAKLDTASDSAAQLTRAEIVILASIVEKEAALASERPRIAGVFYNRLKRGIPLGADPTVRYIFKKFSGPIYISELNSLSPYNTRRFKGLPPGPICSPGLGSLRAAVSPMETNELYFVAKWDGSGGHEFSVTNAEHSRKKDIIRRKNAERLRQKE